MNHPTNRHQPGLRRCIPGLATAAVVLVGATAFGIPSAGATDGMTTTSYTTWHRHRSPSPTPTPTSTPTAPTTNDTPIATTLAADTGAPAAVDSSSAAANSGFCVPGHELIFTTQEQRDQELDQLAASGATWLRLDVSGQQMLGGHAERWAGLDATVAGARARGIRVLAVVSVLPDYERPADADVNYGPSTEQDRANYVDLLRQAVTRYRGQVSAWEIWNEPNLTPYWTPGPSASDYTKLLQASYPVIKSIDPAAQVVTGGTGGASRPTDVLPVNWIQSLYDNGARGSFDAVGIHAYTASWQSPPDLGQMLPYYLNQYRSVLDNNGDSDKQLWATETGTWTGGGLGGSEDLAARLTVDSVDSWMALRNHGPMFFYTLHEQNAPGVEGYLGFFRSDGTAKPMYGALTERLKNN